MSVFVRRATMPVVGSTSRTYPVVRSTKRSSVEVLLPVKPSPAAGILFLDGFPFCIEKEIPPCKPDHDRNGERDERVAEYGRGFLHRRCYGVDPPNGSSAPLLPLRLPPASVTPHRPNELMKKFVACERASSMRAFPLDRSALMVISLGRTGSLAISFPLMRPAYMRRASFASVASAKYGTAAKDISVSGTKLCTASACWYITPKSGWSL